MIIVILEGQDGALKKVSREAISAARMIAEATQEKVAALAIGEDAKTLAEDAASLVDEAAYVEGGDFAPYSSGAHAGAVARAVESLGGRYVLVGATAMGKDLAPRAAMRLGAGLATDVTDLKADANGVVFERPVYAGKVTAQVRGVSKVVMASLRPNAFPAAEPVGAAATPKALEVSVGPADLKAKVLEFVKTQGEAKELTEAEVVVSGGRGLKDPANWHLVEDLAAVLGAAVGASRAVVDAGWRPHHEQVGQTGKVVAPTLYVACGISGAIQHLAGMSSSKCIVAINRDADAPIFKIADYGIVGDVLEVLPALTEELRKIKDA